MHNTYCLMFLVKSFCFALLLVPFLSFPFFFPFALHQFFSISLLLSLSSFFWLKKILISPFLPFLVFNPYVSFSFHRTFFGLPFFVCFQHLSSALSVRFFSNSFAPYLSVLLSIWIYMFAIEQSYSCSFCALAIKNRLNVFRMVSIPGLLFYFCLKLKKHLMQIILYLTNLHYTTWMLSVEKAWKL